MQPLFGRACLTSRRELGLNVELSSTTEEQADPDVADVQRVLDGDVQAFAGIVQRWQGPLVNMAWRYCRDRSRAEEMAQEAFLRAWRGLGQWRRESSFSTWLTRIALNAAFMRLRHMRHSREVAMDGVDVQSQERTVWEFKDHAPTPEEAYVSAERARILRQTLNQLRPRIRAALEIRQLQECSLKETAKQLGITVAAAKGRLFQAKMALRKPARMKMIGALQVGRAA